MDFSYKVYVLLDAENNIIAQPTSSALLKDPTGWTQIDEGVGDRYLHAQQHYLDKPILDGQFRYNYKLIDGVVTEIPEADKPTVLAPSPAPTIEELATNLNEAMLAIMVLSIE